MEDYKVEFKEEGKALWLITDHLFNIHVARQVESIFHKAGWNARIIKVEYSFVGG